MGRWKRFKKIQVQEQGPEIYDWAEEGEDEDMAETTSDPEDPRDKAYEAQTERLTRTRLNPNYWVGKEIEITFPDLTVARTISIDYTLPPMEDPETGLMVSRDFELVEELIFNLAYGVVETLGGQVEGAESSPTSDEVRGLEEEG